MTFSESRPAVCHPAADAAFPEEEAGAHACWGPRRPPRCAEPRCPGSRREPPRTYKQSSLYRQIGEVRASQASRPRESSLSSRGFTGPARRPSPSRPRWLRGRRSAFPPNQSPQGCLDSLLTNSLPPRLGRGHFLQPGQKKAGPDRQGAGPAAEAADPGPQAGPAGARGHRGVPRLPPTPTAGSAPASPFLRLRRECQRQALARAPHC